MIDLTQDPSGASVEILLKSASVWPEGANDSPKVLFAREQADIAAAAAVSELERRTGWSKFVATAATEPHERTFHVNAVQFQRSRLVSIDDGLQRLDSVRLQNAAVQLSTVVPKPDNALVKNLAITHLHFAYMRPRPIVNAMWPIVVDVAGIWGAFTDWPADAWEQVNQYAALLTLTQIENLQNIASLSQDGFSKAYDIVGVIQQKDLVNIWGKDWEKVIKRYARLIA
jgi:hypothetical protein